MIDRQGHYPDLSPNDERLLDALVDGGFDVEALEALSPSDRRRADALVSMFELLEEYPVEDADETLVHATLARVGRTEDERAARMAFHNASEAEDMPGGRRFRLPDFMSVAAVILIGASVVWPLTVHLRERSMDSGCANNMRMMALAFGQYANDYESAMPLAAAGMFPSWNRFNENVTNLAPLVKGGYCQHRHLNCPGHVNAGHPGPSYSYQWQVPGQRVQWGIRRVTVVLGDRNPVIDAARSNRLVSPLTMSINHNGRGQNVLATDGQTIWLEEPVVGRNDNIWLPRGMRFLRDGDQLVDPTDVFLAH